jgi:predicted ATPase
MSILKNGTDRFGYNLIEVAPGAVEDRIEFILNSL